MSDSPSALLIRNLDHHSHRIEVILQEILPAYRIQVRADMDEVGVLFRLCAVLYKHGWNINHATIQAGEDYAIDDQFEILPVKSGERLNMEEMRAMLDDLEKLLFGRISVLQYLEDSLPEKPTDMGVKGHVSVELDNGIPEIRVEGADRAGLLLILSQSFFLMDINIAAARIETRGDRIENRFEVQASDDRFHNDEFRSRLRDELQGLV